MFLSLFLACAVSAMLCEVAVSGVSSRVRSDGVDGDEVKGDMEFDVVLCQSELTERALWLCHLLPPGFMPVSLNSNHTHTHTHPVCLIQWMFNGAEQPFILLCCFYLRQRGVGLCVCVCIVYLCDSVCTCSIRLTSRAPNLCQKYYSFLCLPTFDLSNCSFLSLLLEALFLNPFFTEKYGSCSRTPVGHLSFSCSDCCCISTKYLMFSVSCLLLHFLDIWWDEAVGVSKLCSLLGLPILSLSSPVTHPRVSLWTPLTVWYAVESWSWKK